MREGKLLPNDRFQTTKNNYTTIMWEANLLSIDRFQPKKIIKIMWKDNLLPFDWFQKKKLQSGGRTIYYNYVWQIPNKKGNHNYVGGQFTSYWQIPPDKK